MEETDQMQNDNFYRDIGISSDLKITSNDFRKKQCERKRKLFAYILAWYNQVCNFIMIIL